MVAGTNQQNTEMVALPVSISIQELSKHTCLVNLLENLRTLRRFIVRKITHCQPLSFAEILESFRNAERSIKNRLSEGESFDAEFSLDDSSSRLRFNVKDELLGVSKDLDFLEAYRNASRGGQLSREGVFSSAEPLAQCLRRYHPGGVEKFDQEVAELSTALLSSFSIDNFQKLLDRRSANSVKAQGIDERYLLDYLVTDWDGTFKTYGCNYATCMQPAYSAVLLIWIRRRLARRVAVLTAGPLKAPGVLDLTALNPDDPIEIGGSWGREWLLVDESANPEEICDDDFGQRPTLVDKNCFDNRNEKIFEQLKDNVDKLLARKKFACFSHIGSGYQRKVDRITLGVQNISGEVPKELTDEFIQELRNIVSRVDTTGTVFEVIVAHLDVEIAIKQPLTVAGAAQAWSKRDGLHLLSSRGHLTMGPQTRILVCGDTLSDLPMLSYASRECGALPYAIFVRPKGPNDDLGADLVSRRDADELAGLTLVGCPEVLHVALLKVLCQLAS